MDTRVEAAASVAGHGPEADLDGVLSRVVAELEAGRRFLVVMHEFPDGDALGSALGLARALEQRGREAVVYSPQGPPAGLGFLPGAGRMVTTLAGQEAFDVTLACDAGEISRLGPELPGPSRRGTLINIDHHPHSPAFGDLNLVDPGAASVGVIVHRILERLGHPIDPELATCLWVSVSSDTGNFRHSNTDAECLRVASRLVEHGARPGEISSRMYESQPLRRVRLLAEMLRTLEVSESGEIAWLSADRALLERSGAGEADEAAAGGFIGYPRSIAGVEVALVFREERGGQVKVSLRSRGLADVGSLAASLGGGGHHNASGCSVEGTLDQVRSMVLREVEQELDAARRRRASP